VPPRVDPADTIVLTGTAARSGPDVRP
jgi:hypothetical protein